MGNRRGYKMILLNFGGSGPKIPVIFANGIYSNFIEKFPILKFSKKYSENHTEDIFI